MRYTFLIKTSIYKKIIVLIFLFFGMNEGKCQRAIEINYKRSLLDYTDSIGTRYIASEAPFKPRMIFNDSFALVYFYSNSYGRRIKDKEIGRKMLHHERFYDFITGEKLDELLSQGKEKYILKAKAPSWNWHFLNDERIVLGKTCHAALSVNAKNDSILVWYTNDLAFKKGPLFYDSIPGVVLEAYDQSWDQHFLAVEIKEIDIKIVPPEGTKISMDEWTRIREAQRLKDEN
ncbi:MAG: GLPGLI family protein [Ferruginibacter sp.]